MKSARTSRAWIKAYINDNFVRKANHEGYRSHAAYKLQEIAERDALFSPGMTVLIWEQRLAAGYKWRSNQLRHPRDGSGC